jgi:hypothetical protein
VYLIIKITQLSVEKDSIASAENSNRLSHDWNWRSEKVRIISQEDLFLGSPIETSSLDCESLRGSPRSPVPSKVKTFVIAQSDYNVFCARTSVK